MILQVYIDDDTRMRLAKVANDTGRTIEDLAECAVAETALRSHPEVRATRPHLSSRM